jgi:sarcosine oxidase delta subunit
LWLHGAGCRSWFTVRRDTRTHDILASAPIGAPPADGTP